MRYNNWYIHSYKEKHFDTTVSMSSKDLERRLLKAASHNDVQELQRLLHHATADCTNSSRKNALMLAAEAGHVDAVQLLLQSSECDVTQRSFSGETALHLAAKANNVECCRELLQAGADACARDKQGNTPLLSAAKIWPPRTDILQFLASWCVDVVNMQNIKGAWCPDVS